MKLRSVTITMRRLTEMGCVVGGLDQLQEFLTRNFNGGFVHSYDPSRETVKFEAAK